MPDYTPLAVSEPVHAFPPPQLTPPKPPRQARQPALVLPDPLSLLHRPNSLDSDSSFDDDDDDDTRTLYDAKGDADADKERAYLVDDPEAGRRRDGDQDSDDGWDPLSTGRKNRVSTR